MLVIIFEIRWMDYETLIVDGTIDNKGREYNQSISGRFVITKLLLSPKRFCGIIALYFTSNRCASLKGHIYYSC